ncbi:hypothetical protein GO013_15570 [Pseudodesulfovibrio sp. JC047]|uniref:hypothetical protein n=1 Tax=Pseudodesulfovibrio sp. JC047 TaxID=2683199 RepID=UPI0013D2BF3F|nr:hypothetical protein [Pseudodesulfovibrio sp. JC047]NDV20829.1 hypothetical protein [Pseudodesulfovibrio sp. JC047]
MKIEIINATPVKNEDRFPGDILEVEDHEGRKLIRLGKAKATDGDSGDDEVTLAALKKLNKDKLIETVNREFDLNVDDEMTKADILDLAADAIEERDA